MSEYRAPLEDMRFVLRELAGMAGWSSWRTPHSRVSAIGSLSPAQLRCSAVATGWPISDSSSRPVASNSPCPVARILVSASQTAKPVPGRGK